MKGIIYKYTSPSGKIYIGQTINEKKRRNAFFNLNKSYAGPKINHAREKYGPENFQYEVLFTVTSKIKEELVDILNEKEKQYIKYYDSFKNGYNSDEGGNSCTYERTEEHKKKASKRVKEYYENHENVTAKAVLQYSTEGILIQEWKSARAASLVLDIFASGITNCCKGNRTVCGGFIWKYKSDFDEVPLKLVSIKTKNTNLPLKQYDLKGNFIKEWKTISEAAKELGYSLGNFSTYCNGRNNHEYKGYKYYRGDISLYNY